MAIRLALNWYPQLTSRMLFDEDGSRLLVNVGDVGEVSGKVFRLEWKNSWTLAENWTAFEMIKSSVRAIMEAKSQQGDVIIYECLHRILAEGNFVLTVCEGSRDGVHISFYDLFRIANGKLVEHWDTIEAAPPRGEWKNQNGKF